MKPDQDMSRDEAFLQSVLDTVVDGVITIDSRGVMRTFNMAAERIFGYSKEEAVGENVRLLMPDDVGAKHDGYLRSYMDTGKARIIGIGREVIGRRKDGSTFPLELAISEMKLPEGRAFTGVLRDISERYDAEKQIRETLVRLEEANRRLMEEQRKLVQAEKLSSIGLLASGVAHEVNNPLAGVMGCLRALQNENLASERRVAYFETAQDALTRIQVIVRSLLDYSRQPESVVGPTDLGQTVDDCMRLLTPALRKKGLDLVDDVHGEAHSNRTQLMQALTNVVLNAVHASPRGGTIKLTTRRRSGYVGLEIKDDGPGIPPDALAKVCDPFFTTKPEGEGTGLGLAVTQGLMRALRGELSIENATEGGACITLWMPAEDKT